MKQKLLKLMCLLCISMMGVSAWGATETLSIDFENAVGNYTSWDISNFAMSASTITAHGGDAFGSTNGKTTGYAQTKDKVVSPLSFTCYFSKTSNNITASTWYLEVSTDGSNWTEVATQSAASMNKGTWIEFSQDLSSYSNVYVRLRYNGTTAVRAVDDVVLTYSTGDANPKCAAPTFSVPAGAYTTAQSVTLSTTTDDAIIYYTTNGDEPTTSSSVYSSAISVSTTTTIKAIAVKDGMDNSSVASATYTFVTFDHAGTQADPYTVADAHTAIDANINKTGVYATGIVSEIVTAYSSDHNNITFNFVTTSGDTEFLQAYRCGGDDAAEVQVGDEVIVSGDLTKYGTTYEFSSGCILVSLTHPATPSITVATTEVNVPFAGANDIITVTYNHVGKDVADVNFYESDGTTAATYDWITADLDANGNVEYLVEENTGAARTAYFKVYGLDDDDDDDFVYSGLVTVTQAAYVAPITLDGNFFVKVTSTADITDGAYLIVYEDGSVAFDGSLETLDAVSNTISVTIINNAIAATNDNKASAFIISVTDGTIQSNSGKYIGQTSDSNGLGSSDESNYTNSFEINDGNATIVSGGTYLRYNSASNQTRFRYYKSSSYTNQKAIQLYKLVDMTTLTVSESGYATYYNSQHAYTIPTGLTGYAVTAADGGKLTTTEYTAGTVVPAGEALVLKGTEGSYNLVFTTTDTTPNTGNLLKGNDEAATTTGGDKYYMLSYDNTGANVGFYYGSDDGAAFENGAHKAYLALTDAQAAGVKGFRLEFDATGITGITEGTEKTESTEGAIYNLAGQRVNSLQKGINIVNGKKVLVK